MRGVYIVANDKVTDNAIALISSLCLHDPGIPVYQRAAISRFGFFECADSKKWRSFPA